jgi:rubrerythrin
VAAVVGTKKMLRAVDVCSHKRKHHSRNEALGAAEDMEDRLSMVVYRCAVCGFWHTAQQVHSGANRRQMRR